MKITKTLLGTLFTIGILVGCDKSTNTVKTSSDTISADNTLTNEKINIDKIIEDYAKSSSTDSIKIVNADECRQSEKNIANWEKGIYIFGYSETKKVTGDLNGDNEADYIAEYEAENCWNGSGAGNYLTNVVFVTGNKKGVNVDENMTMAFKKKLMEEVTRKFGKTDLNGVEKVRTINGIHFTEIKNQIAFGEFSINTEKCGGSAQPCIHGKFEYDVKSNNLKMTEEKQ